MESGPPDEKDAPRAQWSSLSHGRRGECEALDRQLVTLPEYVAERASEFRVVRAVGVQSEAGLAYAAGSKGLCAGAQVCGNVEDVGFGGYLVSAA
ncbi:hypothetical protein [Streptomyces sp. MP131-18]|uniref:hypothetical protein n=1 Tax=Streptomyces sp. MP131-18 TaxID=1857892 RepID=UPI0009D03F68|nr:hypothetical protein [Streptomyces sp. MP131-18]ONK14210.1 hypothetical protein STBA_49900 [Streptomyces sp. MP131-18]